MRTLLHLEHLCSNILLASWWPLKPSGSSQRHVLDVPSPLVPPEKPGSISEVAFTRCDLPRHSLSTRESSCLGRIRKPFTCFLLLYLALSIFQLFLVGSRLAGPCASLRGMLMVDPSGKRDGHMHSFDWKQHGTGRQPLKAHYHKDLSTVCPRALGEIFESLLPKACMHILIVVLKAFRLDWEPGCGARACVDKLLKVDRRCRGCEKLPGAIQPCTGRSYGKVLIMS